MRVSPLRVSVLSLLLAASGVTLVAGAPAAGATCTVNLGSCSPESACTVNTGRCMNNGRCTVNVAVLAYSDYSNVCRDGGDCTLNVGSSCWGGHCEVNVLASCGTNCGGCVGDCEVNLATTSGTCAGDCTVNTVQAGCWIGGTCEVNVDSWCTGGCTVNFFQGECSPGGRCLFNSNSYNYVYCTDDCTVMVSTQCHLRAWQTLGSAYSTASDAANSTVATALGLAGTLVGIITGTATPLVQLAQDPDGDGVVTLDEVSGHSDPADPASRPDTDDDGDGVPNQDEQSRAHAMGALTHPAVRADAADHVWLHFGLPGSTASLTSPAGATMRVTYIPTPGPGPGCPLPLPRPAPEVLHDCALPVVVKVGFDGQVIAARAAFEPDVSVPASAFLVTCSPAPLAPLSESCLAGAAVDGTWVLVPAQQAPRASTQVRAPAGLLVSLQGKVFDDVAPDSADITVTGNGQNSRDATMPLRLWNWHEQAPGTTYAACSGGLVAPCLTEGPAEENVAYASVFVGA